MPHRLMLRTILARLEPRKWGMPEKLILLAILSFGVANVILEALALR